MTTNKSNNGTSPFDALRFCDGNVEYWPAKELMTLMGYQQWGEFCEAIDRAIEASRIRGSEEIKNLAGTPQPLNEPGLIEENYRLSRKVCGHIAANGDATKPEIVEARRYFGSQPVEEAQIDLVVAVQDNEILVVDSRLVAQGLGIEHESFMKTVEKYKTEVEQLFTSIRFQIGSSQMPDGRMNPKPQKYCFLTEEQSTFYMALSRNTPTVVAIKGRLVKAFFDAKRKLAEKQSNTVESDSTGWTLRERNNLEKQFAPKPTQKEIRASYGMWKMAHGKPYADRWLGQMHQRHYPALIGEAPQAQEMTSLATAKALLTPTKIAEVLGLLYKTGSGDGSKVNSLLVKLGYQTSVGGKWSATDKAIAANLCDRKPVDTNSRCQKDQLLWSASMIPILQEHLPEERA
jgi:phage regulator Rha-like protein